MVGGPRPEMAPHQLKALGKLHNGCILRGGVGSGKSRVGIAYYVDQEFQIPTEGSTHRLIVITTAKKRDALDWEEEALKFGIGREIGATLAGPIVVDSWNNIHKYVDEKDCFFIFDEQRLVGSGKWTKSFLKIVKHNEWILLSATPGDTWLDYIPVFIANGFYKNRTEFKREHVVYNSYAKFPKVDRYVNVGKLVKLRNSILVEMPYARQTVRHEVTEWVDHNELDMARVTIHRWNIFKDEPLRDVGEMFHVMRKVANSDPSRIDRVNKLLKKHSKLIVFYNHDYELEALREGIVPWIQQAEWNGHKHEEIPTTDEWVYLVQYTAGSEGWNCVETNAICFFSLTYSYKQFEQGKGRIDRMDTPFIDLYYYIFRSKAPIDHAIWRSLKSKKSFQRSDYDMQNSQFAKIVVQNSVKFDDPPLEEDYEDEGHEPAEIGIAPVEELDELERKYQNL